MLTLEDVFVFQEKKFLQELWGSSVDVTSGMQSSCSPPQPSIHQHDAQCVSMKYLSDQSMSPPEDYVSIQRLHIGHCPLVGSVASGGGAGGGNC